MVIKRRAELPHFTSALLIILLSSGTPRRAVGDLHPIVLVPGYSTNDQIEVRLTDKYRPPVPHCGDRKGKGWFRLYLNATWLYGPCLANQMSEIYDAGEMLGVETRMPYFDSTRGFQYRDADSKTEYMARLVERLEGIGYKEGKSLFGAPYDFNHGGPTRPPHLTKAGSSFIRRTTALIEKASRLNGDRPVIIVAHSFGCHIMYFLLVNAPSPWRQRHVKHFIPLAGPWGGGAAGMSSLVPYLPAPGVPVTHIHGTGIPTLTQVLYKEGGCSGEPEFVDSDGDGMVDAVRSLAVAEAWARVPGQYSKVVPIAKTMHLGMLTEEEPLTIIIGEVIAANEATSSL